MLVNDFKLAKIIASRYGYTGLKHFGYVGPKSIEAESIHNGKRIKVDLISKKVYEFDYLHQKYSLVH